MNATEVTCSCVCGGSRDALSVPTSRRPSRRFGFKALDPRLLRVATLRRAECRLGIMVFIVVMFMFQESSAAEIRWLKFSIVGRQYLSVPTYDLRDHS